MFEETKLTEELLSWIEQSYVFSIFFVPIQIMVTINIEHFWLVEFFVFIRFIQQI